MHELALPLLIGLIAVALAFDFLNGLHDADNSIATVVATRLLSPLAAVGSTLPPRTRNPLIGGRSR